MIATAPPVAAPAMSPVDDERLAALPTALADSAGGGVDAVPSTLTDEKEDPDCGGKREDGESRGEIERNVESVPEGVLLGWEGGDVGDRGDEGDGEGVKGEPEA